MRDVSFFRVRRNDQERHAWPQSPVVYHGRRHVIVNAAEIVPSDKDRSGVPIGPVHDGVDLLHGPVLARAQRAMLNMLAGWAARHYPTYGGQPGSGIVYKGGVIYHIGRPERAVANVINGIESGKVITTLPLRRSVVFP